MKVTLESIMNDPEDDILNPLTIKYVFELECVVEDKELGYVYHIDHFKNITDKNINTSSRELFPPYRISRDKHNLFWVCPMADRFIVEGEYDH